MSNLPDWTCYVHHDSSERYLSNPLPNIGESITVRIRVSSEADIRALYLRSRPDGEWRRIRMAKSDTDQYYDWWSAELPIIMHHNNYCFHFLTESGSFYYNQFGISPVDSPDWFNFTVLGDYDAPLWVREQIFYQIFPERFANGEPANDRQTGEPTWMGQPVIQREWGDLPRPFEEARNVDYFGGDLQGITQNLDYLADLGVTAIYLNPIFDAETNHFYLVRDFNRIAECLGGDDALRDLRRAMSKRDMKLILDFTPNHIGFHHPWVLAAREDPDCESAEYFYQHPDTGEIESWLGVKYLAKLNYNSHQLRGLIYRDADSSMRKWLRPPYSIDGYRLDVANMTGNFWHTQRDSEVWRDMRAALKEENPRAYMMGEFFQDSSAHLQGDELDASMNYQGFNTPVRRWLGMGDHGVPQNEPFGDRHPLSTEYLALQWRQYLTAIPYVIALQQFNQIGSHDISRPLRVADGDRDLVKAGTALLMGFPGTPCIYYGDEVGLDGGHDPDNRRCMPWDEREWDRDLRAFHQKLIGIRKRSDALKNGGFQMLYAGGDLIAFQRQAHAEQLIVAAYRGVDAVPALELDMVLANIADGRALTDLLGGEQYVVKDGSLRLEGLSHGQALFLRAD
ncbi:MAG: alpha amylase N-terminal ig-like domain-containing protein [Chloroflexi bacterium]|nr:alpha amylase N-terminal ig-like domain-containing protein [Chloroflexota bacterium]